MGHRLIRGGRKCESQREKELNVEDSREWSTSQCWRDPALIKRLLNIRRRIVTKRLKVAKKGLNLEMRRLSLILQKLEFEKVWMEVKSTRSEVWKLEQPRHQQKVSHLCVWAGRCESHVICKKLDKIWLDRGRTQVGPTPVRGGAGRGGDVG